MQQQTQTQTQAASSRRGHFLRVRLVIAVSIIAFLVLLSVISVLSNDHFIPPIWSIITSAAFILVGAIFVVIPYFFPLHSTNQSHHPSSLSAVNIPTIQPTQPAFAGSSQLTTQATPPAHSPQTVQHAHIFHCCEPLPEPDAFFGREYERHELTHRTSIRASTAIDGEYRIGKSWLLQYLQQVAPTHPQLGMHVKIGKFSATHPQCQTVEGFVRYALETLNLPNQHSASLKKTPLRHLADAVKNCKQLDIIPVLCIDEFAGLIGKPGFDTTFLNNLRSIAEDDGLVLITASREPLHKVIETMTGQTSPLFNIMPRLPLKPFTEPEAKVFITKQGQQAGFDGQEQDFFLKCAIMHAPDDTKGWPPLRLQLVGKMLYNDKRMALAEGRSFDVSDATFQANFKQALYEQYRAMVKQP